MPNELILIVEDNEKNLKLARSVLKFGGFRTIEATSAEAALDLLKEQTPDLILMDIQLPGMDGIAALKALKADPATRDLRVVALTAFAMKGDRELLLEAGFCGYLQKPIDVKAFPSQVRALCDGPAS